MCSCKHIFCLITCYSFFDNRLQEEEEEEEEEQKMEIEMATEEKKAIPHDKENDQVLSEAYAEAEKEQKAATLRAEKSLEERQADFKKMLLEREVHNTVYVVILKEAAMLKDQVFTSSPPLLCVYSVHT